SLTVSMRWLCTWFHSAPVLMRPPLGRSAQGGAQLYPAFAQLARYLRHAGAARTSPLAVPHSICACWGRSHRTTLCRAAWGDSRNRFRVICTPPLAFIPGSASWSCSSLPRSVEVLVDATGLWARLPLVVAASLRTSIWTVRATG